jgi:hypothetical protein
MALRQDNKNNLFCYKHDYSRQHQMYKTIKKSFRKLSLENKKGIIGIKKILTDIKNDIDLYPDRGLIVIRSLGVWSLPPSFELLEYLKSYVSDMHITTIIDYGTGLGLWPSILHQYFNESKMNIEIIGYDKIPPLNNTDVYRHHGYYNIVTELNLKNFDNNTLLLLLWPPYMTNMAYDAITTFRGKYLLVNGCKTYTANDKFYMELDKWNLVCEFNPLSKMIDDIGSLQDTICIYKKIE